MEAGKGGVGVGMHELDGESRWPKDAAPLGSNHGEAAPRVAAFYFCWRQMKADTVFQSCNISPTPNFEGQTLKKMKNSVLQCSSA